MLINNTIKEYKYSQVFDKNDTKLIKGIAILLMVFHHTYPREDIASILYKNNIDYFEILAQLCKVCVTLLTILSGYGLYKSYEKKQNSYFSFTLSHYIQLLSSYIPTFCFLILFNQFFFVPFLEFYDLSIKSILYLLLDLLGIIYLFGIEGYVSDWYLPVIIVFYFLFIPIVKLMNKYGKIVLYASFLPWIYFLFFNTTIDMGISGWFYFAFFVLGIYLAKTHILDYIKTKKDRLLIPSIFLLLITTIIRMIIPLYFDWLFAIAIIMFALCIITKLNTITKILQFLGKHSTNIWLIHLYIRITISRYLSRYSIITYLLILLISLLISCLLEYLKNKTHYNDLISKLRNKICN